MNDNKIKVVFLGDTHVRHHRVDLPSGDLLCFTGDFMSSGYYEQEVLDFIDWLKEISHKYIYIVCIAGNHDRYCESFPSYQIKDMFEKHYDDGIRYIQNEGIILDFDDKGKLKLYGTPYQNFFCGWAWNIENSKELEMVYEQIVYI
ncbi:MAG: metallophosphoesterase [Lachnospiraceae bacterium]|nr:metallophosphoesterase [Lachnospiraceae bacterium]